MVFFREKVWLSEKNVVILQQFLSIYPLKKNNV